MISPFTLSQDPLNIEDIKKNLMADDAGAFNYFEGMVRNHHDGKKVIALEYEAFESLCQSEGATILKEAHAQFDITKAQCTHRTGKLSVGETSVWIGVTAPHRDAAFSACRYIIDQIKARLPIWKKEYYETGESQWVNCQPDHREQPLKSES